MKKLILMVEDDPNITELVSLYVEKEGWRFISASDAEEGLAAYYDFRPDMVLLDIMLPGKNGWELCRELRREDAALPILMLTGKTEQEDVIFGLETGADDYVAKPFDPQELTARIKALMRRAAPFSSGETPQTLARVIINTDEMKLIVDGEELVTPPRELKLLSFFMAYPGQTLSREQLINEVWGWDYEGDWRTVDVHIKRLRRHLESRKSGLVIQTVRGLGYRLELEEETG
jgi:DNA-binding response OmpR family regulator